MESKGLYKVDIDKKYITVGIYGTYFPEEKGKKAQNILQFT